MNETERKDLPESPESPETVETEEITDLPETYETTDEVFREAGSDAPIAVPRERMTLGALLKPTLALFLICAIVAGIVAGVNALTADTIAARRAEAQQAAIARIFGEGANAAPIEPVAGTKAVYAVGADDYCVSLETRGFGGKLSLMVGVSADGHLRGVEIVSHSETPGFGAKADDPAYLDQYADRGADLALGRDIDAISGATITSRALLEGINAATRALITAGLVPEYHSPIPEPPLSEEEQLERELAELYAELGIETDEYGSPIDDSAYEGGDGE